MNTLSETIANSFIHNFRDFETRVHVLAAPLSEEQFWEKPYRYGNSFGNLVLHITGNLNYYIGTQIAQTGYVRDRPAEFTNVLIGKKSETLLELHNAVEMVIQTLGVQHDDDWSKAYSGIGIDDAKDRFGIFLRCAVHFHHHIGQMIYLSKEFTQTP